MLNRHPPPIIVRGPPLLPSPSQSWLSPASAIMLATRTLLKAAEKAASGTAARAVSAKEAPSVTPAKESTTETMMPWNGWFSSFLKDKLGAERYDKLRRSVLYQPDDIHNLNQAPNPMTKVPLTEDGKETAQFRYPSPGSQDPVDVPMREPGTRYEDPFVTSHYTQDTARRHRDPAFPDPQAEKLRLELLPQDDPRVIEAKEKFAEGPKSSPGNKGMFATGKSDFDPEGLRATMSANHEALEKALDENMPDHLPYPEWWDRQEEIIAWYDERDLPIPLGATGPWGTVPREGRIARW